MTRARGEFVVFAKVPEAGLVKTRLQPAFSARQAADFYEAMLDDVLAASAEMASAHCLEPVLALHPWTRRERLVGRIPRAFRLVPQRGVNLAARMTWAIREAAAGGSTRILLRGSDNPTLDSDALGESLAALDHCDLVVRPDCDGGYGLIGVRRPIPGLFEHEMSSATVLADTLAKAAARGLRAHTVSPGFDIDTVADLAQLAAAREAGRAGHCPRTLAYLDAAGLWRVATRRAR